MLVKQNLEVMILRRPCVGSDDEAQLYTLC
jgi:hypothetical protein